MNVGAIFFGIILLIITLSLWFMANIEASRLDKLFKEYVNIKNNDYLQDEIANLCTKIEKQKLNVVVGRYAAIIFLAMVLFAFYSGFK